MQRRLLLALGLLLAFVSQALALAGQQRTVMMQPPGWVQASTPGAAVVEDFANGRFWTTMGYTGPLVLNSITRAGPKTVTTLGGLVETITNSNQLAYSDQGESIEEARTNVTLWNRDLTNAVWTKTTATAALDQTGADGTTNSASSLLATAGNATCLQAITLASSARFQTAYVKRLIGSGVINMTMDNGVTWTAITLTTNWARVSIPTQTLANPTVGFQIVTNGDKIAVDYVQNENGTFATSVIATTTVAVARAADNVSIIGLALTALKSSSVSVLANANSNSNSGQYGVVVAYDGTSNNRLSLRKLTTGAYSFIVTSSGVSLYNAAVGSTSTLFQKGGFIAATGSFKLFATGISGSSQTGSMPIVNQALMGMLETGGGYLNGYVSNTAIWSSIISNLQSLTAP